VWLAPEQVRVLPLAQDFNEVARTVTTRLRAAGIRAHLDDRPQTLNYRVREVEVQKVPYMAVIGRREAESDTVAVRTRGAGNKQDVIGVDEFVARVKREVETRALTPT
jgi:threonyl-tRNA synthetase